MLNTDASADSVITIDNNNSLSSSDNTNNDSRRRQRDHDEGGQLTNDDNASSSSPSQRQPHHVMTQPVFLQLIFPFVPTKSLSTPLLFNSVSTSWSETIQHYSGAQLCWNALVRSGVVEKDDEHDDDDVGTNAKDAAFIATRFNKLLDRFTNRTSVGLPAALDTILILPHEIAKRIVAQGLDKAIINNVYRRQSSSLQVLEQLFAVVERFEGADALKKRLERIDIAKVAAREHNIVAHFFETVKRLGVDSKQFFNSSTRFGNVVRYASSIQTLKMAIDICRGVSDDFLKSLLERRRWLEGNFYNTLLQDACEREILAVDVVQILLELMKELFGTTSEMFNRGVFTAEEFRGACYNRSSARSRIIKVLVNASGVEQLCDTTHSTPLQLVAEHCPSADSVRAVIERCRELGGSELVRKQLELTGKRNRNAPFTCLFSKISHEQNKVQYFIELIKSEFGMDRLKQQLLNTNDCGDTLLLAICRDGSSEQLRHILDDVFKANNFTDEELLAHFQYRNRDKKNVLMLACEGYDEFKNGKVKLLTSELLRLQHQVTASSPLTPHQQQQRDSLLKGMLEQECNSRDYQGNPPRRYTPLMYALGRGSNLEVVELLFNLFRNECSATVDEIKHHLKGALRVCISESSSIRTFSFLWQECLGFNDDAFSKSVLEMEVPRQSGGHDHLYPNRPKHRSVLASIYRRTEYLEKIAPHLVKFDLFEAQYTALDGYEKGSLKEEGFDDKTPLRLKLEQAELRCWTAERKLARSEEKLSTALEELSKLRDKNS